MRPADILSGHRLAALLVPLFPTGRGLEALLRGGEILLQLGAQALFGVERGLCAAVLELGGLARVPLRAELSLERRALGVRLVRQTVKALDGGLRALVGLLGPSLRRAGELL